MDHIIGQAHPAAGTSLPFAAFSAGSSFINASGVHTSAGVPPHAASINPTGTPSALFSDFPK